MDSPLYVGSYEQGTKLSVTTILMRLSFKLIFLRKETCDTIASSVNVFAMNIDSKAVTYFVIYLVIIFTISLQPIWLDQ